MKTGRFGGRGALRASRRASPSWLRAIAGAVGLGRRLPRWAFLAAPAHLSELLAQGLAALCPRLPLGLHRAVVFSSFPVVSFPQPGVRDELGFPANLRAHEEVLLPGLLFHLHDAHALVAQFLAYRPDLVLGALEQLVLGVERDALQPNLVLLPLDGLAQRLVLHRLFFWLLRLRDAFAACRPGILLRRLRRFLHRGSSHLLTQSPQQAGAAPCQPCGLKCNPRPVGKHRLEFGGRQRVRARLR
mmetsp:Transcript_14887/g.42230  ORF Transcript_14887/g.42230 Transcript_14887/m.42230 type:complete len:244 (+) Transcript_14887:430-1161(+)